MSGSTPVPPPRAVGAGEVAAPSEVRDWRGRQYLVGPTAVELSGRRRGLMLVRVALVLGPVGLLQFAYGAVVPTLVAAHEWSVSAALVPFAVWAVFQGAIALPVSRLRDRGTLSPRRAVAAGAVLCAVALATLGHVGGLGWFVLGYGVLGGIGSGLVYHSCVHVAAAWFPERPTESAGLASGVFALGSVPVAIAALLGPLPGGLAGLGTVAAVAVLVLGAACAPGLTAPPPRWWPPETDPRAWALIRRANPSATTDLTPAQAWRSGAMPALHVVLALAGAVSLFDLAVLPVLLLGHGNSAGTVAAVAGALIAANGVGRIVVCRWSETIGRQRALAVVLGAGGIAHLGILLAGPSGALAPLVVGAVLAGAAGGAAFPLVSGMAVDYFGLRDSAHNQAFVYSAKALGGVIGVGGAAVLIALVPHGTSFTFALLAAGLCALVAAWTAQRLRRPFHFRTIPV